MKAVRNSTKSYYDLEEVIKIDKITSLIILKEMIFIFEGRIKIFVLILFVFCIAYILMLL